MNKLCPYLIFPGTCREAMGFYAECLGGEITILQTFAEAPLEFPEEAGELIFNSEVRAGELSFMASDCLPGQDLPAGENIALFVVFEDAGEQERVYEALGAGGKAIMPLADGFGMLADRYQMRWMLALKSEH